MFSIVSAQINNPAISSNLSGLEGSEFLGKLLSGVVGMIMVVGGIIFVFMIVWGGIKYVTSEGDKAQTEAARKTITNALIGIVVVFALYAIINIVSCFFGLSFLGFEIGELNVSFSSCPQAPGEHRDPNNPGPW